MTRLCVKVDRGKLKASATMVESKVFDELRAVGKQAWTSIEDEICEMVRAKVRESTVVIADNVAEHLYASRQTISFTDLLTDFPNVAPPWKVMFIESKRMPDPKMKAATGLQGFGILFEVDENEKDDWESAGRWNYTTTVLMNFGDTMLINVVRPVFHVTKDGSIVSEDGQPLIELMGPAELPTILQEYQKGGFRDDLVWIAPAFMALCYANCRNVSVKEVAVPEKVQHKRKKRGFTFRYYVLEIQPMRELMLSEGGEEMLGIRQALHICRGHFKDFSEKGLFGKHHGMYWWADHARGNPVTGVVTKDYQIATAKDRDNMQP